MVKKLKKYSKIVSLSTILLSTGCTPLAHTNNQSKATFHLGAQSRALKSLQATKYSNELCYNSEYDAQNVTETRFNDYFNAVSDKLQYELWAANCSDEEVYSTVGTFKANVLNCELSEAKDEQEKINIKYAKLRGEAKKLGIDVIDFDLYRNFAIPKLIIDFKDSLSRNGFSKDQIELKTDVLEQNLVETFKQANDNLWDETEFSIALPSIYNLIKNYTDNTAVNEIPVISLTDSLNNIDYANEDENEYKCQLTNILTWLHTHYVESNASNDENIPNIGISLKKEVDLSFFSDYNSDPEKNGYNVGDTIDPKDMSQLFDYSYSKVQGCDYANEFFLDDIEPTESGEYNKDILSNIYEVKSLDTYDSAYATYGLAEILPGFTLNAKIKSLDSITDSHKCSLEIELGISHSSNPDYVLWSDFNFDLKNTILGDDKEEIQMKGELPCLKKEDIKNVSKNKYLSEYSKSSDDWSIDLGKQDSKKIEVNLPKEKPEDPQKTEIVDVYFSDSAKDRTKLDDIMAEFDELDDSDTYDLANNPVILDQNATKGIISEDKWKEISKLRFHTNQFLAPIATRIDTNEDILWINLCVIDVFNKKIINVYDDITWNIKDNNGNVHHIKSLPVQYNVDAEKKEEVNAMEATYTSFYDTMLITVQTAIKFEDEKILDMKDKAKIVYDYNSCRMTLEAVATTLTVLNIGLDIAMATIGKSPVDILDLVLGSIMVVSYAALLPVEIEEFDEYKSNKEVINIFETMHKVVSKYKDKFDEANKLLPEEKSKEILAKFTNPILKYSKRIQNAEEARDLVDKYEEIIGLDFITEMQQKFPAFDLKNELQNEQYKKFIETWANIPELKFSGDDPDQVKEVFQPFLESFYLGLSFGPLAITTTAAISSMIATIRNVAMSFSKEAAQVSLKMQDLVDTIDGLKCNSNFKLSPDSIKLLVECNNRTFKKGHVWTRRVTFRNDAAPAGARLEEYVFADYLSGTKTYSACNVVAYNGEETGLQFVAPAMNRKTHMIYGYKVDEAKTASLNDGTLVVDKKSIIGIRVQYHGKTPTMESSFISLDPERCNLDITPVDVEVGATEEVTDDFIEEANRREQINFDDVDPNEWHVQEYNTNDNPLFADDSSSGFNGRDYFAYSDSSSGSGSGSGSGSSSHSVSSDAGMVDPVGEPIHPDPNPPAAQDIERNLDAGRRQTDGLKRVKKSKFVRGLRIVSIVLTVLMGLISIVEIIVTKVLSNKASK